MDKKHLLKIIMTLLVICLALTGCGKEDSELVDDGEEDISLEVVYNLAGWSISRYGAGNESGYYDVMPRIWDLGSQLSSGEMDSNIVYVDYSTKTRVFLCNNPSCRHNDDSCTSYIKSSSGIIVFPVGNEKIVCLRYAKEGDVISSKECLAGVLVMKNNGSDRREICTLDSKETFSGTPFVASDGNKIYLLIQKTIGFEEITRSLCSIDITTGERINIIEIPNNYYLSSVYDDSFLFTNIGTTPVSIMEYSLLSKEFKTKGESATGVFNGSKSLDTKYDIDISEGIFMISKAHSITVVFNDAKDGSTVEYGPFELEDDHGAVGVTDYCDGYACITYASNISGVLPTQHFLHLDLDSGVMAESSLLYSSGGANRLVAILADAGDKYLVGYDTRPATLTFYDREGIAHEVHYPEYLSYALIKKTDYYANNGIFEPIEDATVD